MWSSRTLRLTLIVAIAAALVVGIAVATADNESDTGLSSEAEAAALELQQALPEYLASQLGTPEVASKLPAWATLPAAGDGEFSVFDNDPGNNLTYSVLHAPASDAVTYTSGSIYAGDTFDVVAYIDATRFETVSVVPNRIGTQEWQVQVVAPDGIEPAVEDDGSVAFGVFVTFDPPVVHDSDNKVVDESLRWSMQSLTDNEYLLTFTTNDDDYPEPYVVG